MDIKKLLLLIPSLLFAEYSFKVSEEKYSTYTQEKSLQRAVDNEASFRKDGKVLSTDGTIVVSFKEKIDLLEFEKEYGVEVKEKISPVRENYIFTVSKNLGLVCENIGKDNRVRYAIPNWKNRKSLY